MDGVDKAYPGRRKRHHDGLRTRPVTKETNPLQEISIGNAAGCKHDVTARREFLGCVDLIRIANAHLLHSLALLLVFDDEPAKDFAVETAQRGSRQHAFRSAARTHYCMHSRAGNGGSYAGR